VERCSNWAKFFLLVGRKKEWRQNGATAPHLTRQQVTGKCRIVRGASDGWRTLPAPLARQVI